MEFFKELKEPITIEESKRILEDLELDTSEFITYTEFIAATMDKTFFLETKYLKQVFARFDIDNCKKITKKDLQMCFRRHGKSISGEQIRSMIKDFDLNKNNTIGLNDFLKIMQADLTDSRNSPIRAYRSMCQRVVSPEDEFLKNMTRKHGLSTSIPVNEYDPDSPLRIDDKNSSPDKDKKPSLDESIK